MRTFLRRLAAGSVIAAVAGSMTMASAANVNVSPTSLTAFTGVQTSGAPTVYVADNFTGPNTTNLDGRTLATGGSTWDVITGTWRLNGANAVNGVPAGASPWRVITNAGQTNVNVTAVVNDPTTGERFSGIILRSNAAGSQYFYVEQDSTPNPDVVRFGGVGWLGSTVFATAPVTLTGPATMSVEAVGNTYTVFYNGVQVLTYTLSAFQAFFYPSGTYHGLHSRNTGANAATFSDFRVEAP